MMKLPRTMCTILACVAAVAACGGDDATETVQPPRRPIRSTSP
jgi:hypothetical protein